MNFQESTIGAAFFSQILSLSEATIKFDIWDTAGQERYHSLAPMYYRGAAAAIVVYDISSTVSCSFKHILSMSTYITVFMYLILTAEVSRRTKKRHFLFEIMDSKVVK